jgi:prepilin-type N-terminal cleavage/methylation domain-containing protein
MKRESRALKTPLLTQVRTCSRTDGFTLIEVLLAALIMGFGLSVLLVGTSRCLYAMKTAQQYQTAQWIMGLGEAEHPLLATNDVEALNVSPVSYDKGYTFERKVDEDDDDDGLYVVHSLVKWPDRNANGVEEAVRYVYKPKDDTTRSGGSR